MALGFNLAILFFNPARLVSSGTPFIFLLYPGKLFSLLTLEATLFLGICQEAGLKSSSSPGYAQKKSWLSPYLHHDNLSEDIWLYPGQSLTAQGSPSGICRNGDTHLGLSQFQILPDFLQVALANARHIKQVIY